MLSLTSPWGWTWAQNSGVRPRRSSGVRTPAHWFGEDVLDHQRVDVDLDGLAVAAGGGPDQAAAVVVDHPGEVPVALSMREVIDPDQHAEAPKTNA